MARIGISEYQVFQAADQLAAEGLHPSVDLIRVKLGNTGSRTTINNYLKRWRERRAHRDAAGINLSAHLRQVITEQCELLLSALEAESSGKIQAKTQEFNNTIEILDEKYRQLESVCKESQTTANRLQEINEQQARQLLQLQSEHSDAFEQMQILRETLARETGRREALERNIDNRDRQLITLQNELKASQARNEILGESLASKSIELQHFQQREREQLAVMADKNSEIKQLNHELNSMRANKDDELERLTQTLANFIGNSKQNRARKTTRTNST